VGKHAVIRDIHTPQIRSLLQRARAEHVRFDTLVGMARQICPKEAVVGKHAVIRDIQPDDVEQAVSAVHVRPRRVTDADRRRIAWWREENTPTLAIALDVGMSACQVESIVAGDAQPEPPRRYSLTPGQRCILREARALNVGLYVITRAARDMAPHGASNVRRVVECVIPHKRPLTQRDKHDIDRLLEDSASHLDTALLIGATVEQVKERAGQALVGPRRTNGHKVG